MLTELFYRFSEGAGYLSFDQLCKVVLQLQPSALKLEENKYLCYYFSLFFHFISVRLSSSFVSLRSFLKRYMVSGTMNLGTFIETCIKTDLFFILEAGLLLLSRVFQTKSVKEKYNCCALW
jgi:hypothetical protein